MTDESVLGRLQVVEARLAELEAERDVRRLLTLYSTCADSQRDDDWLGLWDEDGVLEIELGPESDVYAKAQQWHGHAELRRFISNPAAHHRPGFYGRSLHVHGDNTGVRVRGLTAVAATYSVLLHNDQGAIRIVGAGVCSWRFVNRHGRWSILECRRRRVGAADTAAILDVLDPRP